MAICVYDNPATMMRECWQSGRLQAAYSFELYAMRPWPVPPEHYHLGANLLGDWKTGQMVGDAEAMKEPTP